jgi:hypothetical protein
MHLPPFTNSHFIYYFLAAGVLLFVMVRGTQMF